MKKLIVAILLAAGTFEAAAMPSRAELRKVSGTVNELMSDDMKGVKSGKLKRKEAADHAVGYAREATDEASKFLFYKGAFGLYVRDRAFDDAMRAIDLLRKEVKDIPDKVLLEIVGGKMKDIPRENGGALVALYESLDRKIRHQGDLERLQSAVKKNPKDDDARRQLAVCRAQLGDWPAALKDFSLLTGAEEKAAKSESIGELKQAADGWWALGANADEDEQALFRSHAADLYRRALAKGKLSGIQKSLAQKRADEYPAEAVGAAKPAPTERVGQDAPKPVATATKAVVKPGKGITLSLKKGVPLEFVHCPAGTYTKDIYSNPHKVTISRPFYMTRTPVTIEQYIAGCLGEKVNPYQFGYGGKTFDRREFGVVDGKAGMCVSGGSAPGAMWRCAILDRVRKWCDELTAGCANRLPKGYAVRLPSAAEFEYAARAGSDDKNDLFVKQGAFTGSESSLLRVSEDRTLEILQKSGWDIREWNSRNRGRDGWAWHVIGLGGYPWPVASCRANAWGISDVRGYFNGVVVADRWIPNDKIIPYFVGSSPIPSTDGEIDPVATVPSGVTAGHLVLDVRIGRPGAAIYYDPQKIMLALNRVNVKGVPVEELWFGGRIGFFLVIAPDVKTLTPITPPKE